MAHPITIGLGWALILLAAYPLVLTATRRSRLVAVSILYLYAVGVAIVTIFPTQMRPARRWGEPWWAVIQLVPFEVPPLGWILNVVMFVPLGVLAPRLWPRMNSVRRAAVLGLCASTTIELTQLLLWVTMGSRRTVDLNDLIANTLGALLGLLVLRLVSRPATPGCSPPASPRSWWRPRAGSSGRPPG